jgi:sugar/nucleoside kinase (ribokinase family)
MRNVFVAGPVSWNQLVYLDRLPEPRPHTVFARRHVEALGGTSAGKSLNLAALGADVTLSTVVGDDEQGAWVRERLTAAGVRLLVDQARGATERHLNLMTMDGRRLSIYLDLSPVAHRRADEVAAALAACEVAVIDLSEHSRPLLAQARAIGRPVWCDIHDYNGADRFHRDFIEAAEALFLNDDGMADPLPFMRDRVAAGTEIAVLTQGAAGATAVTRSGQLHVPCAPVEHIVDTNGAGDAFFAGFLLAHLDGASIDEALRAGHAQAARCLASQDLAPT